MTLKIFDPSPRISAIVDSFLNRAALERRYTDEVLAERRRVLKDFAAYVGDVAVDECDPDQLLEWLARHPKWAPSTLVTKLKQIQACFNWAAGPKIRKIAANPFDGIALDDQGEPRRAMRPAEFRALLRASKAPFRRFLLFLWLTGCRAGEARGIVWAEIDWDLAVIIKQRHKTRKKTRKPRVIYLTGSAKKLLAWLRRQAPQAQGEIFRNQRGRPWLKQTLDTKIQRMRERLGLPADTVLHLIRHAFGTRNARRPGANLKLVSMLLGHASVSTTERFYVHVDRAEEIRRELGDRQTIE